MTDVDRLAVTWRRRWARRPASVDEPGSADARRALDDWAAGLVGDELTLARLHAADARRCQSARARGRRTVAR